MSIRGDPDDPLSKGHICPKAYALKDLHEDPDRLERPLVRRGRDFEEVSWDVAFDEAEDRIARVLQAHGAESLGIFQGNPTAHTLGGLTWGQFLFRNMGTPNLYSPTSADQLPHMMAAFFCYGHQLLMPVPDVDRADLLVVIGADPLVSGGSLMTAPGMRHRLKALRDRSGRLVVVDPRRSRTAEAADQHLSIKPGTDALLLLGLLHEALEAGAGPGRLAPHLRGEAKIRALASRFSAEVVAGPTGIDAAAIRELGQALASTPRAAVYGRFGICTQPFGGLCQWLLQVLHAMTGHLDEPGGLMFTTPAVDVVALSVKGGLRGGYYPGQARRGLPVFGDERPVAVLLDELGGPTGADHGSIKALLTHAGNPVLSVPGGHRIAEALSHLEAMVSVDIYLNETTRHAHVILPPSSPLTRENYDLGFHALAVRNTARWSAAVFDAPAHTRQDWEILAELCARLLPHGGGGGLRRKATSPWLKLLLRGRDPALLVKWGIKTGPYGKLLGGLSLSELKATPSGVDLGPLVSVLPSRLCTDDGKVHLDDALFHDDVERLWRTFLAPGAGEGVRSGAPSEPVDEDRPLLLIGRRQLRSNNSWMHNLPSLAKGKARCTAWIHPEDADRLGVEDGGRVVVESRTGAVTLPAELTDKIRPGVVSVPHGFGHDDPETRLRVASARPGVNVNVVTDPEHVDVLSGNIAFSAVPVSVRPAVAASAPGHAVPADEATQGT